KNDRAAKIHNGDVWTVTAIDDRRLTLKAKDGRRVTVPHQWAQDHLELAYAATVDSAQGVTVDRAVVALSPLLGRTRLYSATTRGRQAPIYVADRQWGPAFDQLQTAIQRDDLAKTMREILATAHQDLRRDLTPTQAPRITRGWDFER
ncbi:MAG: hypothetical protein OWU84_15365, partial [Firmicutes bacterium]|nr:hypothetical protein [Bacillota bacterium]